MPTGATHTSPYSGRWYPGEREELEVLLDGLWRRSRERTGPGLRAGGRAFIVPHAGLIYSGTVAAAVYRHLEQERPRRVLIAGFSHRGSEPGIRIPTIDAYETPLGRVEVDVECAGRLTAEKPFKKASEASVCDHSIEIQLPLLQKAAPEAKVVPLYVGPLDEDARRRAARELSECLAPGTVLIASSDLTHFGKDFGYMPFPVDSRIEERLRALDEDALEAAGSLRDDLFLATLAASGATVCGYDPIALLLATVSEMDREGEMFQETLDYQTSGATTGDFHHSVSYGTTGFFPWTSFELDADEQRAVLDMARRTLAEYQRTGRHIVPDLPPAGLPGLARKAALFVTLHKNGKLRGCVGRCAAIQSIETAVPEMAIAAAADDSRFEPVSQTETGLEVEVSILSPMKRIADLSAFRVNEHGALLKAGRRQGLLLPQVATERNWNAGQFFDALAQKAGVPSSAYGNPATRVYVFRAQVIH